MPRFEPLKVLYLETIFLSIYDRELVKIFGGGNCINVDILKKMNLFVGVGTF